MVFVPHVSDTAQHINVYTRQMLQKSVVGWFERRHVAGEKGLRLFVVEYPTNHVPILPPSDKNLIVAFTDPMYAEIKHQSNKAHVSQEPKQFDMVEKFIEAVDAVRESDDTFQISRAGRRFSRYLSGVQLNPRRSRGEHFGVTCLSIRCREGKEPVIVEERVKFPMSQDARQGWFKTPRDVDCT